MSHAWVTSLFPLPGTLTPDCIAVWVSAQLSHCMSSLNPLPKVASLPPSPALLFSISPTLLLKLHCEQKHFVLLCHQPLEGHLTQVGAHKYLLNEWKNKFTMIFSFCKLRFIVWKEKFPIVICLKGSHKICAWWNNSWNYTYIICAFFCRYFFNKGLSVCICTSWFIDKRLLKSCFVG